MLGVASCRVHFMGLRDTGGASDGPELTAAIETIIETIERYRKPVIFAPWINDPHGDHDQSVSKMATLVSRILAVRASYLTWFGAGPCRITSLSMEEITGWRFFGGPREGTAKVTRSARVPNRRFQRSDRRRSGGVPPGQQNAGIDAGCRTTRRFWSVDERGLGPAGILRKFARTKCRSMGLYDQRLRAA